jgi:peptidyl-Lys metalloendopeptidase
MKIAVILALFVALAVCKTFHANIEVSQNTYVTGDKLPLRWELALVEGIRPLRLLTWNTPLEGAWNSYMFTVINVETGRSASYQGRVYKRATPTFSDYTEFVPNAPLSGELDLAEGYNFYTAGRYEVTLQFNGNLLSGETFTIESNTIEILVVEPDVKPEAPEFVGGSRAVKFNGCTSAEQSTVNTAINNAITASANAKTYLAQSGSPPKCTSTYVEWFGSYSSSNWNTVESHFNAINNLLSSKNFGIDCTCNQPGTYAYVYPTDTSTHTIYLCPVFWDANTNAYRFNSQPGTLSHESSHFNDVAKTDDYQYGVAGCRDLATTRPGTAIQNADSHEYFQESGPSTSC